MSVDVVVVNHRTPGDLAMFLCSLEEHAPSCPWSLWIVNVQPDKDDVELAGRWIERLDNATHVAFASNVGFNVAANTAGGRGQRPAIAVFNADVVLAAGALDEMLGALDTHPSWALVGPRQVDDNGRLTAGGVFGTPAAPKHRGWRQHGKDGRYSDVRGDCVTVAGSAFVIRRSVWQGLTDCPIFREHAAGEFGPLLPCAHYYGETGLCYHAVAHGWDLGYLGTTTIRHKYHQASPVGGFGEKHLADDREKFRAFCTDHAMAHER